MVVEQGWKAFQWLSSRLGIWHSSLSWIVIHQPDIISAFLPWRWLQHSSRNCWHYNHYWKRVSGWCIMIHDSELCQIPNRELSHWKVLNPCTYELTTMFRASFLQPSVIKECLYIIPVKLHSYSTVHSYLISWLTVVAVKCDHVYLGIVICKLDAQVFDHNYCRFVDKNDPVLNSPEMGQAWGKYCATWMPYCSEPTH